MNTDRLFFALRPDAAAAARIAALATRLAAQEQLAAKPLRTDLLHVTLHFLGDHAGVPEALVARALHAAASVAMQPFEVIFDRAGSFPRRAGRAPVVLTGAGGLAGVEELHRALAAALTAAALPPDPRHYRPHLTLMYAGRAIAERPAGPVTFLVREVLLMRSLIGRQQHLPLAVLPLGRAADPTHVAQS